MRPLTALAFAPAVISNFFAIHTESTAGSNPDFWRAGATGGGFTLSKGVYTTAWIVRSSSRGISVAVNGRANYPADTTIKAVDLLLDAAKGPHLLVELVQRMEVPIRAGFGSSSASALSAVMAVAAALELPFSKEEVAFFAHKAEIIRRTGLGTVSSTYEHSGAGILTRAGGPGVARVFKVPVPREVRVLAASLPPYNGRSLLSSPKMRKKVNHLGEVALERASDLRFESLLVAGHEFAKDLGLTTQPVKKLIATSLKQGAIGASQNMVGNAMHAVVRNEDAERVLHSLASSTGARLDSFRIGGKRARVLTE